MHCSAIDISEYRPPSLAVSLFGIAAKGVAGAQMLVAKHRIRAAARPDFINSLPVMISVHVPKTGGVAFRSILHAIYGRTLCLRYGKPDEKEKRDLPVIPANTRCIHGHFASDAFDNILPNKALITWIRHPVQQVVSTYRHFLRNPDPANRSSRMLHDKRLSLREFAALDGIRNITTGYFLKNRRLDDFFFLGITEHFDLSIALFLSLMGIKMDLRMPRLNADRFRRRASVLPEEDLRQISLLNRQDIEWYEEALRQFTKAAGAISPGLPEVREPHPIRHE